MNRPRFKEGDARFSFGNAKPNFNLGNVQVGTSWVARPSTRMSRPYIQSSPFCHICNIQFFSEEQLSCHLLSKGHTSKTEDRNFVKTMQNRDLELRKELYMANINKDKFAGVGEDTLINSIKELEIKEKTSDIQQELKLFHCPACNVDLNSIAQAKQHLSGSRHLKMSKDVNPLKRKMLETPFVSTTKKASKKSFYCGVCDMELNSVSQADAHFASSKHLKRDMEFLSSENSHGKCSICNVDFTSEAHAQEHYNGKKHANKLRENQIPETPYEDTSNQLQAQNLEQTSLDVKLEEKAQERRNDAPEIFGPIWSAETPEIQQSQPTVETSESPTIFLNCQLCRLSVNSESQLKAHHTSKKHLQAVQAMTKRGCGRGRGFMLNQLKQSLTTPGRQNGPEHGKLFKPPFGFQVSNNQSKSVSGFSFSSTRPRDETS